MLGVYMSSSSARVRLAPCTATGSRINRGGLVQSHIERRAPVGTMRRGEKTPESRTRLLEEEWVLEVFRFKHAGGQLGGNIVDSTKQERCRET